MNVREAFRAATGRLTKFQDHRSSASLDAELLVAHALRVPREALYTHPERVLTAREVARLRALLQRRARHEPIAYILGEKEFYGLRLKVTQGVLIPRPETEGLVEAVLLDTPLVPMPYGSGSRLYVGTKRGEGSYPKPRVTLPNPPFSREGVVIDVGTGSGAIAIALARSFAALRMTTFPKIIATDVSRSALTVARSNARRHGIKDRIKFVRCDLLPRVTPSNSLFSRGKIVIVANLPYLPTKLWRTTTPEIKKYEPREALDGGKDGLDVYRRLLDQIRDCFVPANIRKVVAGPRNDGEGWTLLAEMLPTQTRRFSSEVRKRFPRARIQRVGSMILKIGVREG